ncbi:MULTISPECIES: acetyl/propionyl/methylcrotonyl-CoA carboxylase subunit alpha [Enterobacterales]|uniref:acetyl/propionyl/methylcrotonyl-CoA carboxylase subunit alpha n=1 Tax=Enterobacterales TaxID=91347 RepID=UPI0008480790|nr:MULTISPECIES: biotin carboxylase N-terminal domain-containing protein [Enterobacterales]WOO50261.1 biotin carboxylase N-terminal domain-containing protein [Hafnia alvei]MCT6516019.1 ATP-grasp domain-containing protein [Proteus vulgaris]ODQ06602.1 acetyl/propionyl-CoA carboxylase subuit alpha [Shigella sp. FC130]OEI94221.1 acetyl/propionyl-CoA carboxylase subuit alpha [Shigella sp. FC1655]WPF04726.1 biotin carboxylase N-terminal domain-containing protein [Proteus vulgaris]
MTTTNQKQRVKHRVLIANRGEIAVRIIRACQDHGATSIAIYANDDIDALHVRLADEAYGLKGNLPKESYLDINKIIEIAHKAKATMIHPGYGFLSERADFAKAVQDAGFIWIGPNPETIEVLGDKVQARKIAQSVGAPLVNGTADPVNDAKEVLDFAKQYGLPVAIKAAFGGGGRGLKIAYKMEEIEELYHSAVREAVTAFGRGECYVEQFLDKPRHIEAQIIADKLGHVVVVGTRDCSLQRRNQKLIEEAPAPYLTDEQRERIHQSAKDICAKAGYVGAGTVEFLLSANGTISFLEVNTRLQVEHPVTEETAGIDLVIEQLRIAEGLPLSIDKTPVPRGHSFEFRINAEDPAKGFLPTPGLITHFSQPSGPGVRVDSGVAENNQVSRQFDSMMAKLIVTGATRKQAIARARRALSEFKIEGVASVLPFHCEMMAHTDFTENFKVHTRWIETDFQARNAHFPRSTSAKNEELVRTFIEIDGRRHELALPAQLLSLSAVIPTAIHASHEKEENEKAVTAPISGVLHSWILSDGDKVKEGDVIAIMEAMKMEVQVVASCDGVLVQKAKTGDYFSAETVLAEIN